MFGVEAAHVFGGAMDGAEVAVLKRTADGHRITLTNTGSRMDQEQPIEEAKTTYTLRDDPENDRRVLVADGLKWPFFDIEGAAA